MTVAPSGDRSASSAAVRASWTITTFGVAGAARAVPGASRPGGVNVIRSPGDTRALIGTESTPPRPPAMIVPPPANPVKPPMPSRL